MLRAGDGTGCPAWQIARTDFGACTDKLSELLGELFSRRRIYYGIMAERLFVSQVLHATYVKVDEQGTEAAATTAIQVKKEAPPEQPVDFRVNRPFVFIIRDNLTGSVLFLGRVLDPRKVGG